MLIDPSTFNGFKRAYMLQLDGKNQRDCEMFIVTPRTDCSIFIGRPSYGNIEMLVIIGFTTGYHIHVLFDEDASAIAFAEFVDICNQYTEEDGAEHFV